MAWAHLDLRPLSYCRLVVFLLIIVVIGRVTAWSAPRQYDSPPITSATAAVSVIAPLTVSLSLFDGTGLSGDMLELVRNEVEVVLGLAGVQVYWLNRLENPYAQSVGVEMKIIMIDVRPERWGLGERVMGTVLGNSSGKRAVYVFYPSVLGVIKRFEVGFNSNGGPSPALGSKSPQVARALARVAVHELIHIMTPGRPHARSGLMKAKLDQNELLAHRLDLDEDSISALQAGLGAKSRR